MLIVEQQQGKHLAWPIPQLGLQIVAGQLGRSEGIAPLQLLGQMASGHLQHRLQLGIFGWAKAVRLAECPLIRAQQAAQRAELIQ